MFYKLIIGLVLTASSAAAMAAVPFTFTAGAPARASEVNADFQNLDGRVSGAVGRLTVTTTTNSDGSGVVGAICPQNTLVVGVGATCDYQSGARNFGVLFGSDMAGNGGVVGCFPESSTFNPNKPNPLAKITLKCLGATDTSGQALLTTSSAKSLQDDDDLQRAQSELQYELDQHMQQLRGRR